MPTASEMLSLAPGTVVTTPYGTASHDPASGEVKLNLSAEGQQRYREAMVKKRSDFGGHPFHGIEGLPEPELSLGRPHFNPFINKWGR